ncbi:MAG: glycosyltransferase [Ruminococcaceae bacterium]|jgi:glycosyltransferase involved in cell wall biosynthesis|nr:glycosyltransferase [Oscillospiraceae bacterium]
MFISFIVPVYNVENYVRECVDSLLSLAFIDFEVLLVIGESDDDSDKICWEYGEQNERVCVVTQTGKGLSDARNCGFEVARGDYIAFIDSDDYVVTERLQAFLHEIRLMPETDVFVSDFVRVFEAGKLVENHQIELTEHPVCSDPSLDHFLGSPGCFWNVWRYIYKKDFLTAHQLWFKLDVFSEDVDYTIRVLLTHPQVTLFHNPYYCYRVRRPDSLMTMNTLERLADTVTIVSDCAAWAAESNHPCRQNIVEHMAFEWVVNMAGILEIPKIDRRQAIHLFQTHQNVLNLSHKRLYRFIAWFIHSFGIFTSAICFHILKRIRRFVKEDF